LRKRKKEIMSMSMRMKKMGKTKKKRITERS